MIYHIILISLYSLALGIYSAKRVKEMQLRKKAERLEVNFLWNQLLKDSVLHESIRQQWQNHGYLTEQREHRDNADEINRNWHISDWLIFMIPAVLGSMIYAQGWIMCVLSLGLSYSLRWIFLDIGYNLQAGNPWNYTGEFAAGDKLAQIMEQNLGKYAPIMLKCALCGIFIAGIILIK